MDITRETINISPEEFDNFKNLLFGEDCADKDYKFKFIEESIEYYDLDKSYEETRVIVQRKSDKKYFETIYTYYPNCINGNEYSNLLTEVFPKEKTIIVYE